MCHGQGNPESDGCCWVAGAPCPLRWKLDSGRVYDHEGQDLGTVAQAANLVAGGPAVGRVVAQLQGPRIVCRAALEVIAGDETLLGDRARFEDAWNNHPEYVAKVRPEWARVEARALMGVGSYQCSTWAGMPEHIENDPAGFPSMAPFRQECCWAETDATNDARAAKLAPQSVEVRSRARRPPVTGPTPTARPDRPKFPPEP